ncbi:MAG: sulfite exporter TauE/SafE family protein [Promethearchaeota archaeon]
MILEVYQIILLIFIGALVGISMSFIGQTGQGVVVPLILIITGDVFLAIAISVLNDLIAAIAVGFNYTRNKQFYFRRDILILMLIASIAAFFGVFILITTPLGAVFGWGIPIFIICLGFGIIRKGFPTSESVQRTVNNIIKRFSKNDLNDLEYKESQSNFKEPDPVQNEEIQGFIKPHSKLFYILAIILGMIVGFNSGMFGASSGFIITIVLIILYGYPIKKSVGTALLLSIFMCFLTFSIYQLLGFTIKDQFYYNWEFTLYLGIGSFITGFIVSNYVQRLSAKAMGRGMGATMISLGIISLIFYFLM